MYGNILGYHVQSHEDPSLDEMWNLIEKFGLSREMIEDRLAPHEVLDLYISIKDRKSAKS